MKRHASIPGKAARATGLVLLLAAVGGGLVLGCATHRRISRVCLPDGDPLAGKAAFGELMCYTCHQVAEPAHASAFPAPTANPPVPVALGAEPERPTRDELVTSIIAPSHEIAPGYRAELVSEGTLSRMGDYTHLLTVRQLSDLVAFLESLHSRMPAMD